ncbi:hypothetical protein CEXT_6261 [Caerostris extrusa]|uniref:Uncharacterized protein n=1 Tax=Caerostris extrusa TaxID=172846 RepID=A0AAV4VE44_CAEEX|nr:hypothetical protein CEXT_6261 [Caerostris extrusa]
MRDELILGTEDADALKSEIQESENVGKIEKHLLFLNPVKKLQSPVETKIQKRGKNLGDDLNMKQSMVSCLESRMKLDAGTSVNGTSVVQVILFSLLDSPIQKETGYMYQHHSGDYLLSLDSPLQFNHQTFQSNQIPHLPYEDVVYDFENFDFDGTQNGVVNFGRSRSNFGNYNNECYSMTRPRVFLVCKIGEPDELF